jgi:hypothetical protein
MRKSLVDGTLRKFFELDQPKAGIKQDHGEDFAIKGAPCSSGGNISTQSIRAFMGSRSSQAKPACSVTIYFQSFA